MAKSGNKNINGVPIDGYISIHCVAKLHAPKWNVALEITGSKGLKRLGRCCMNFEYQSYLETTLVHCKVHSYFA